MDTLPPFCSGIRCNTATELSSVFINDVQSFSGTAVTVSLHLDTSDSHMYVFSWFTKIK